MESLVCVWFLRLIFVVCLGGISFNDVLFFGVIDVVFSNIVCFLLFLIYFDGNCFNFYFEYCGGRDILKIWLLLLLFVEFFILIDKVEFIFFCE